MANTSTRQRSLTFDPYVYAPDDELLDRTMTTQQTENQEQDRGSTRNRLLNVQAFETISTSAPIASLSTDDDEDRIPPPIEVVGAKTCTSRADNHPDFASWKRDVFGTLPSSSSSFSPNSRRELIDWKTAQISKRLEKQLRLQEQLLRTVKSDISNDDSNESSYINVLNKELKDNNTFETRNSSYMLGDECKESNNENQNTQPMSEQTTITHSICKIKKFHPESTVTNVYVRQEKEGKARRCHQQDQQYLTMAVPPNSPKMKNHTISSLSLKRTGIPEKKNNSTQLAAIMMELAELKDWVAKDIDNAIADNVADSPTSLPSIATRLRQSTPPSSPTSPAPPASRDKPELQIPSLDVPNLVSPPLSPEADHSTKNENNEMIKTESPLKVETNMDAMEATMKSKEKKSVRFASPEITDTIYRPFTPQEEINTLFFQEDELLDWENDEETTVRDRFEVIVTEIETSHGSEVESKQHNDNSLVTGSFLNIGTPIISFHNSYSCSFQESSDDDSSHYENNMYEL